MDVALVGLVYLVGVVELVFFFALLDHNELELSKKILIQKYNKSK